MRKTYLRTDAMHKRYLEAPKDPQFFKTAESLATYKYWRVIKNQYPYDAIAVRHNLLIPYRQFRTWTEMLPQETAELFCILQTITDDQIIWNCPVAQSIPQWFHIHLILLRIDLS